MTTVFTIARNRSAEVAKAVLGTQDGSIAVTDRFSAYDWIAGPSRQICWSHLRRDFQAMIDRGGAAEVIGRRLLVVVGPIVPVVAPTRGWEGGPEAVPSGDEPDCVAKSRRRWETGARCAARRRWDLRRDPAGGGEFVDVRAGRGRSADEQRGGASRAPRGDLASDQRRHGQCAREPVRGADVDGGGDLPSAGAKRAGLPDVRASRRLDRGQAIPSLLPVDHSRTSRSPDPSYATL